MGSAANYLISGIISIVVGIVNALELVIFIWAVLSWLIAFDVVNIRNMNVRRIVGLLDSIVSPLTRPFRRFIPNMGPVDLSPMALILALEMIKLLLRTVLIALNAG